MNKKKISYWIFWNLIYFIHCAYQNSSHSSTCHVRVNRGLTRRSIQDMKLPRLLSLPPQSGFCLFVVYLTTLPVDQTYRFELLGVITMEADSLNESWKLTPCSYVWSPENTSLHYILLFSDLFIDFWFCYFSLKVGFIHNTCGGQFLQVFCFSL
jgi:hypothetical protein